MYNFDIAAQTISIKGKLYHAKDFCSDNLPDFASYSSFHNDLYLFLKEWFSDSPVLKVHTSGSTGIPKEMDAEKNKMMQSASLTCSFLKLSEGDSVLLCMPLKYIGAKMIVVRALIAGLDLYLETPSGNPLKNISRPLKFAAMTPMQVFNTLQSSIEKQRLTEIDNLIIGGGAIDPQIQSALKDFPNNIYSTYGMTETLSHIALQRLNGRYASDWYIPFPSVSLSLTEDQTLIINAPLVTDQILYTNDIADLQEDGRFRIMGRKDNVINSGGIKIQIEELEAQLKPFVDCSYAITSLPDPKYGEIIILAVENKVDEKLITSNLSPYVIPKKIMQVRTIPLTETGKISRIELKKLILEIANS